MSMQSTPPPFLRKGFLEEADKVGPTGIEQRRIDFKTLVLGQHLRQFLRVAYRGLQWRHMLVRIDADDECQALGERELGADLRWFGGVHSDWSLLIFLSTVAFLISFC